MHCPIGIPSDPKTEDGSSTGLLLSSSSTKQQQRRQATPSTTLGKPAWGAAAQILLLWLVDTKVPLRTIQNLLAVALLVGNSTAIHLISQIMTETTVCRHATIAPMVAAHTSLMAQTYITAHGQQTVTKGFRRILAGVRVAWSMTCC